jgi:hypothetical protein
MKTAKLLLAACIFIVLLLAVFIARAQAAGTPAVTLVWTASSGVVSNYFVERSTSPTNNFTEIATLGPVTTYSDTNGVQGTFYWYRVRAGNPAGRSGYSNTAGALFLMTPGNPGNLTVTVTLQ